MAKSVADLALAMNILAGHDPRDPATPEVPVPNYNRALGKDLEGIRLGVPDRYYFDRLDEEVHTAVKTAIQDLKGLGAKVQPISIPGLHEASTAAFIALVAEGAAVLEKWHLTRSQDLGEDVRARLNLGAAIKATQYLKAQRVRGKVREIFMEAFKKVDGLVTPQLPITAPRIGQSDVSWGKGTESVVGALTRFTRIYNLIGIPSLCLPCGFSSSGMPIGLQIAAKPFAEETVLKVGHAYEVNTSWKSRHPLLE
jgi:aspartyl-tRNA(Asn)/glutamyl-tRNA(Gln) amidotransferase subunit A